MAADHMRPGLPIVALSSQRREVLIAELARDDRFGSFTTACPDRLERKLDGCIEVPKLMKDAMERNVEWFDRWIKGRRSATDRQALRP